MRSARIRLPGHPDAACDVVAETIVDEYLRRDPEARIRVSVTGGRGALFVAGDVKTTADFDVAALVRRTLGSLGVIIDIEPFVSIEPVAPEAAPDFLEGIVVPYDVMGYATDETPDFLPAPVSGAIRIAKRLDDLRTTDEQWFWLGPDAEVFVQAGNKKPDFVSLHVEHGMVPVADVRKQITELAHAILPGTDVRVNEFGATDARGLAHATGTSSRFSSPYGSVLPSVSCGIGMDPRNPKKAAPWILRAAARELVKTHSLRAAFIRAVYLPGDREPRFLSVRDELGKDRTALLSKEQVSLDRINEWIQPGLSVQAARYTFVGDPSLPWEMV
jgi:S-adenosylmethionine synthetase